MANSKKKLVRANFRNGVVSRDGDCCKVCGRRTDTLDIHHITDRNELPNGGYVPENGIGLCGKCHELAEVWHSSGKTTHVPGYHPDDLYKKIGSSYEKAYEASKKL